MRPFVSMRANVALEIEFGLKGSIAHVTFEGPLASVSANMILEMACVDRRIWTMWTDVQDHETDLQT